MVEPNFQDDLLNFKKGELNIQDAEVNIQDAEVNIQDVGVNLMQLSECRRSDCSRLTADPAGRMHREGVHGKCGKGKTGPYAGDWDAGACPAIRYRNRREGTSGTVKPVSYYHHPHYTGDIHYAFSEEFIERNSRFSDGYRDVCVDALNRLSGRYARLLFSWLSADMYEFHFGIDRLRKLLNIEDTCRKPSSIKLIFGCVRKEFGKTDLDFDCARCTQEEWEERRKGTGDLFDGKPGPDESGRNSVPGQAASSSKPRKKNKNTNSAPAIFGSG
jgi:hypothetical protein